jgi:hypothetical protein
MHEIVEGFKDEVICCPWWEQMHVGQDDGRPNAVEDFANKAKCFKFLESRFRRPQKMSPDVQVQLHGKRR